MTPAEYLKESARTDGQTQRDNAEFFLTNHPGSVDDLHSVLGIITETGELADALKKAAFYGREFDLTNVKEELGDLMWYVAKLIRDHGWTFEEIMALNIAKLKARFPNNFTNFDAIHRNLGKERNILEQGGAMPTAGTETKGGLMKGGMA